MAWWKGNSTDKTSDDMLNKQSRVQCWNTRDAYYNCLNGNNIYTFPDSNDKYICNEQKIEYNKSCARTWIEYFNEKRVNEYKKKQFMQEIEEKNSNR